MGCFIFEWLTKKEKKEKKAYIKRPYEAQKPEIYMPCFLQKVCERLAQMIAGIPLNSNGFMIVQSSLVDNCQYLVSFLGSCVFSIKILDFRILMVDVNGCFVLRYLFFTHQVIILIGNKADLEAQRDVTYEEAKQFAEENGGFKTFNGSFGRSLGRISKF